MKYLISFWPFLIIVMSLAAYAQGMNAAAWVLGVLGLILLGCLMWIEIWNRHIDDMEKRSWLYDSRARFVNTIAAADGEARRFIADQMPEIGVEFGAMPIFYILENGNNTGIKVDFLRKFLTDSSENVFADVHRYNDDKFLQERFGVSRETVRDQWHKVVAFLVKKGYLLPNSAAGPHSYRWRSSGHYRRIAQQYSTVIPVANLDEVANA